MIKTEIFEFLDGAQINFVIQLGIGEEGKKSTSCLQKHSFNKDLFPSRENINCWCMFSIG